METRVFVVVAKNGRGEEMLGVFSTNQNAIAYAEKASLKLDRQQWYIDIINVPLDIGVPFDSNTFNNQSTPFNPSCDVNAITMYINPCADTCTSPTCAFMDAVINKLKFDGTKHIK